MPRKTPQNLKNKQSKKPHPKQAQMVLISVSVQKGISSYCIESSCHIFSISFISVSFKNKRKTKCLSFLLYQFVSVNSNMEQDIENYESWYTAARFLWDV